LKKETTEELKVDQKSHLASNSSGFGEVRKRRNNNMLSFSLKLLRTKSSIVYVGEDNPNFLKLYPVAMCLTLNKQITRYFFLPTGPANQASFLKFTIISFSQLTPAIKSAFVKILHDARYLNSQLKKYLTQRKG